MKLEIVGRKTQPLSLAAVALISAMASACSTIGHERVAGWPLLETIEHYVPHSEMRNRCARYVPAGSSPEACAEFNFAAKRCDIWFSGDFPPAKYVIEHEREHCLGYEHAGEHEMRGILARYLASLPASQRAAVAALR